jgi:hypothetical protein
MITEKKVFALCIAVLLAISPGVCQTTPLDNSHPRKVQSPNGPKAPEMPASAFMEKKVKSAKQPNTLPLNHNYHAVKPKQPDKVSGTPKSK